MLGVALAWRHASRHRRLPCPAWLGWLLDNPYTAAVAGSATLLDRADIQPGMRVLDVGSGPGRVTIPAARRVTPSGEVVALDVQERMLSRVRRRAADEKLTNVRTIQGGVECGTAALGLEAGTFHRALLVTVLGEIPDREGAMQTIYDALAPDGILSVTELIPDPHFQTRRTVGRLASKAGFLSGDSYGGAPAFTLNFRKPSAMRLGGG